MTIVLIISIALSISVIMENKFFRKIHQADKFVLSFVMYLFLMLIVTYFYTISSSKDHNRYILSIIAILIFFTLVEFKSKNNYEIKIIFTNSVIITSSIVLIWQVAQINFVQDKFTNGDSYSYAFGALDLNSQGDIKPSDWTKFMTSLQAVIPSISYYIKTLKNSSSAVDVEVIITAISFTSILVYLVTLLTIIRIIGNELNKSFFRNLLIVVSLIFMSSDFVAGPLSIGTAINASISHMLLLFTYLVYVLSKDKKLSSKVTLELSMIINILVLINYPIMLPISFGLTFFIIIKNKQNLKSWSFLFLFTFFILYLIQVLDSLIRYNNTGIGGSFAKSDFEFYLIIFAFTATLLLLIERFYYYTWYFPAVIMITFLYMSIPYIVNNQLVLNYYNTKYLYLLMVPALVILMIIFCSRIEKNQPHYIFQLLVFTLLALSLTSSFYNNTLITKNLQSSSMRNSIKNLSIEKNERIYYVDYIDEHDELLLNLWADTRNIDYSTPWVIGNNQSQGVSIIFAEWQSPPADRICRYVESFPESLIITKNENVITNAEEKCAFDFELR